jgi:hypothetical protein
MGMRELGMKKGLILYAPVRRAPSTDFISVSRPTVLAIGVDRTLFRADLVFTAMCSCPNEDSIVGELASRQL